MRVYCDTDFDAMSPMLFCKANHIFAFAFVADASNMQIPLHIFATDASRRKWLGKERVIISKRTLRFKYKGATNHHLLTSPSKFEPIHPEINITPN